MLQGLALARDESFGFTTDPPFREHIMLEPLPKHFKMTQLEIYDGSINLVDHVDNFKSLMLLHKATNGVLCRAFLYSLKKST